MCQMKCGAVDQLLRTHSRPTPAKSRRMHLITEPGFGRRLSVNLLTMACAVVACSANRHLHDFFLDAYHDAKDRLMQTASEMAWWSVLGLLSSSCCAVQLLLNALAFGCAGFNSVLGPIRPTFIAMTMVAQASSWYVAYSRPQQWKATLSMTMLSLFLTLLPEALAHQTARRARRRQQLQTGVQSRDKDGFGAIHLRLRVSTMGCSSCVATVSKVLDGIQEVLRYQVTLEDGHVDVEIDEELSRRRVGSGASRASMNASLTKDIADRLLAAGFPVDAHGLAKRDCAPN